MKITINLGRVWLSASQAATEPQALEIERLGTLPAPGSSVQEQTKHTIGPFIVTRHQKPLISIFSKFITVSNLIIFLFLFL